MESDKKLPNCPCGKNHWKQGGGSFSPTLNQQLFVCAGCTKTGLLFSDRNNNVFLIYKTSEKTRNTLDVWMNDALLPTWRDYQERLDKVQLAISQRWLKYVLQELELPEGTKYDTVPEEKKEGWNDMWSLLEHYPAYTNPSSVPMITVPPKLPTQMEAYVKHEGVWKKVDPVESNNQVVPADPILTHHDAYYKETFDALEKVLGCILEKEYIQNEYNGAKNQPWFQFKLGANTIKVGPRKRVTAIKLSSTDAFNATKISEAAIGANVSYWSGKEGGEERIWKNTEPRVKDLEVHAWNKEQLIQFLTIICEESLQST